MNPIVKIRVEPHPDADDFVIVVEESGGAYTIRHDKSSPITATESVGSTASSSPWRPREDLNQPHRDARALKLAASTAEPKSPPPMLACVHIAADKAAVKITATDLTVSVTARVAAKVTEAGAIAVDARAILDRVGSLAGDDVTITQDGMAIDVAAGRAKFRVPCLAARDYPKVIEASGGWSTHDAPSIAAAFGAALPAACTDATRFHLGESSSTARTSSRPTGTG